MRPASTLLSQQRGAGKHNPIYFSTTPLRKVEICVLAVFLVSFAVLAWNIRASGIAAAYVDPIAQIRVQDEATYAHAALQMVNGVDWTTPHVAGRLFLLKPPLLIWLTALSIRCFGFGLFAIRLPAILFGAAGVAAIFAWAARARSLAAASLAAGVLLASPFWQTCSRVALTDVLCASSAALALSFVAFDPQLLRRRTRLAFAILGAASILAKSVAGVLPFAALLLCWALCPRERRPKIAALAEIALVSAVLTAPWYSYQIFVHPKWFWAENIQSQLLSTGVHWDRNSVIRNLPVVYYLKRLVQMDPAALLLGAATLMGIFRPRDPLRLLALCWAATSVAALCLFQAASLPYLALVLPAICVAGAICGPKVFDKPGVAASVVGLLFLVKAAAVGQPWSMRPSAPPVPGAMAMLSYSEMHRERSLISVDPDDEFVSLTLPIRGVRYCVLDTTGILGRFAPYLVQLGVLINTQEFLRLAELRPEYEKRLKEWGVDSGEAIASTIVMNAPLEISAIVNVNPDADFYLPTRWLGLIADPERSHTLFRYSQDRVFLLARGN